MSFVKSISLDKEAYDIWERRFGAFSQGFSSWVSAKLKEEELTGLSPEIRKKLIQKKKEDAIREISKLEEQEKNTNEEIKFNDNITKKEIELEKIKSEILKKEKDEKKQVKAKKSLALHKAKAIELFDISEQDADKYSKQYLNEKNHGSFTKYFEKLNFKKRIKK